MSYILDIMYCILYIMSCNLDMGMVMSMTHKEITAWVSLAVTLAVFGYYVAEVPHALTAAAMAHLYIGIVVAVVLLEIVAMTIASLLHRPEKTDERDRAIATRAYRNAYFVAAFGASLTVLQLLDFLVPSPLLAGLPAPALVVHALVLTLAAAEVVRCASLIFYYRRGA